MDGYTTQLSTYLVACAVDCQTAYERRVVDHSLRELLHYDCRGWSLLVGVAEFNNVQA